MDEARAQCEALKCQYFSVFTVAGREEPSYGWNRAFFCAGQQPDFVAALAGWVSASRPEILPPGEEVPGSVASLAADGPVLW